MDSKMSGTRLQGHPTRSSHSPNTESSTPTLRSSSTLPLLEPVLDEPLFFIERLVRDARARPKPFHIPPRRKMATPAPTSRTREAPQGDEEASSELKLGEFQDVDALTHSEAALVINALVSKRRGDRKNVNDTEMLNKTQLYLDHFARFKRKENVEAVERLLSAHKELAKFERAQLGSLCCDTAEEAKTLIPSLTDKITDDDLQELLNEITKLMGYGNDGF